MHTFKNNNNYNNKSIKSLFYNDFQNQINIKKEGIKKLQELQAPVFVIEEKQKELNKMLKKGETLESYIPYLTYKDNIKKLDFLDTKIENLKEEYNKNNKLIAYIVNEKFYINLNTRYCPIISLYNK